eukprot:TRINITY_DN30983_c0_g1_i1.p1 TRINITY_DN30983_c0_g1~~TRINITY_DN30983_c0_g1_i1.p1  ORF type:complete len:507 (+),score=87.62 TRINITY_DN30983_c0_g1_i1:120-1640(+)
MEEWRDPVTEGSRRIDIEAKFAAAAAVSAGQLQEMSRCLEGAYAKIEVLQQQARVLNEEANGLSEENDRLAMVIAEKDETIKYLRDQVLELSQTVSLQETELQNHDFHSHMTSIDQSMAARTTMRYKRGAGYRPAFGPQRAAAAEAPGPVLEAPAARGAPPPAGAPDVFVTGSVRSQRGDDHPCSPDPQSIVRDEPRPSSAVGLTPLPTPQRAPDPLSIARDEFRPPSGGGPASQAAVRHPSASSAAEPAGGGDSHAHNHMMLMAAMELARGSGAVAPSPAAIASAMATVSSTTPVPSASRAVGAAGEEPGYCPPSPGSRASGERGRAALAQRAVTSPADDEAEHSVLAAAGRAARDGSYSPRRARVHAAHGAGLDHMQHTPFTTVKHVASLQPYAPLPLHDVDAAVPDSDQASSKPQPPPPEPPPKDTAEQPAPNDFIQRALALERRVAAAQLRRAFGMWKREAAHVWLPDRLLRLELGALRGFLRRYFNRLRVNRKMRITSPCD